MTAIIKTLFVQTLFILSPGVIYGGTRFDKNGNEIDTTANGFYLNSSGILKANLQSLFKYNVLIGTNAGLYIENSGSSSNYNTIVGDSAGMGVNGSSNYYGNSFFGYNAGARSTSGGYNSFFGYLSGFSNTTGAPNCFFGYYAGQANTTGFDNCFFGDSAGFANTTGNYNCAFGHIAGNSNTTYSNTTCLGSNSQVTASNQLQLGDSATTTYCYGSVQNRSDARDKTNIRDTILGLDFIKELHPVDFKWNYREDYTEIIKNDNGIISVINHENDGSKIRKRYHHGLIAQEVKNIIDKQGIDFGGYQDHSVNGGKDVLSLGYTELIAPIIKSIQEIDDRLSELEGK
jgi:hypothetical protein